MNDRRTTFKIVWESADLEQVHIDHAQFQRLNDQVYLSLGQTFIPIGQSGPPETIQVKPKGRFVMSLATARSIAQLLYRNFGEEKDNA